jgi:hypothetical protein
LTDDDLPMDTAPSRTTGRPQQSWKNQVMDFMTSRNMEEDMAEDGQLCCWEWIDGS